MMRLGGDKHVRIRIFPSPAPDRFAERPYIIICEYREEEKKRILGSTHVFKNTPSNARHKSHIIRGLRSYNILGTSVPIYSIITRNKKEK